MNIRTRRFLVGMMVVLGGWGMLGVNLWLFEDYKDCDYPKATFDMMVFSSIGMFSTIYVAFLSCKIDLIDRQLFPMWHSIINCLLALLIPCSVVKLILMSLAEVNCRDVLLTSSRVLGWISAGVGTVYSLFYMVTALYLKTRSIMRESRLRKRQERYEAGVMQLKTMTHLENYVPRLFLEVYSENRNNRGALDSIEMAYLMNYCTLKNLSLYPEQTRLAIAQVKDVCPICHADMCQNGEIFSFPRCEHKFDVNCVKRWLEQADSCPICKGAVRECLYDVLSTKPPIEANPMFSPSK